MDRQWNGRTSLTAIVHAMRRQQIGPVIGYHKGPVVADTEPALVFKRESWNWPNVGP